MKRLVSILALLGAVSGCSKDPATDPNGPQIIIETGYVECGMPVEGCDGITTCVESNDAQICVQSAADRCADELTCACVGEWVCGDLTCSDTDSGFTCGDPPQQQCIRLMPEAIDFGNVLVSEGAERLLQVEAACPADINSILIVGDNAAGFEFDVDTIPALPVRLETGDRLDLARLLVTGIDPVAINGAVRINDDPELEVPIQANLIRLVDPDPCLTVQPANIDLGQLIIDERIEREITVRSTCGAGPLNASTAIEPGSAGSVNIVGAPDQNIAEGQSVAYRVAIDSGFETDTIEASVTIEGFGEAIRVPITGEVVRPLIGECILPNVNALDFGEVEVGQMVQRNFEVTINCGDELTVDIFADPPPEGEFAVTSAPNVPVGPNDVVDVTVRFTATAPGEAQSHVTLASQGAPLEIPLRATVVDGLRCDSPDSGCPPEEGIICNEAGDCARETRFVLRTPPELGAVYVQEWPVVEPFLTIIENGNRTYNILKTCDACGAAPDCAEQPDTVQRFDSDGRTFIWSGVWWQSDDDNDDCARPFTLPDGSYEVVLCYSYDAEVDMPFSADGRAPGMIGASLCAPPVAFDLPTFDDVVIEVPAP